MCLSRCKIGRGAWGFTPGADWFSNSGSNLDSSKCEASGTSTNLTSFVFSQNISSVQFGREGRAAALGGCRDTNPGSNPGSPQWGYSGFPIKLDTLCWRYFRENRFKLNTLCWRYFREKISGELFPETDLKFSAHSKKKSTPQNNEQN